MKRMNLLFRRLWQNRLFTFLNIVGLAIGISACWIVFRIVNFEYSFDKDHPDQEKIFKVYSTMEKGEESNSFDGVNIPIANYVKENIASAELVAPEYKYYYEKITVADADGKREFSNQPAITGTFKDYFSMVPYTWLAGNKETVFKQPNEIVLSNSRARFYFPNLKPQEVLGKVLQIDTVNFTVTGVIQDLEKTSSFREKEFVPVKEEDLKSDNWDMVTSNHKLYVKLTNEQAKQNFIDILTKKSNEVNAENLAKYNVRKSFGLAPLQSLHFNKMIHGSVDKRTLYGIIGIGSFLLVLASINYINLTTAQVPFRAKEIGIRKTLGEQPRNVLFSFITETFLISCISLLFSWPLIKLFEKYFSTYIPADLNNFSDTLPVAIFLFFLILLLTLVSSFYPAYLINKVQISEVIKMKNVGKLKFGSIPLRKALIIFQFVIAQIFVISTVLMGFQIQFMLNKDLGFQHNSIVSLDLPHAKDKPDDNRPNLLKESLQKYKEIEGSALGHLPMSGEYYGSSISMQTDTGEVRCPIALKYADQDYLDTYNFKLLAGRNMQLSDSTSGFIVNEKLLEELGIKTPEAAIGQSVIMNEKQIAIIGVLQNFNSSTLHSQTDALAIFPSKDRDQLKHISIKLSHNTGEWRKGLEALEKEWKNFYPNDEFDYTFFDDNMKELYESDYRFSSIINLSSGITVLLSCLGLIGLVTISISQRTKEIGIRKVLGSSVSRIIRLLSTEYLVLVFISIIIASPVAWWAINKWLENFAYKMELTWWMFSIPAIATLIIAFLTMFYHSFKAAIANPVDCLRDE
ncbi:ABC transporter permease [Sphingobacterium lactis]|uniref:ABC-type transport system, involved in lipoprotein release, permease component n=1 Tax=Sphingobacterium lactis TaxID=797291 RepID=A0A1H5RQJ8_9SPHI|nr:FtsX-like permease family protein [Sphingobacterium lactis]SEF39847.1 ABC-type transport system, involved in lipoprotein release, permease component [Sphingobacterium lactis]